MRELFLLGLVRKEKVLGRLTMVPVSNSSSFQMRELLFLGLVRKAQVVGRLRVLPPSSSSFC